MNIDPIAKRIVLRSHNGSPSASILRRARWVTRKTNYRPGVPTLTSKSRMGRADGWRFGRRHRRSLIESRTKNPRQSHAPRAIFGSRISNHQLFDAWNGCIVGPGRRGIHTLDCIAQKAVDPQFLLSQSNLGRRRRFFPVERSVDFFLILGVPLHKRSRALRRSFPGPASIRSGVRRRRLAWGCRSGFEHRSVGSHSARQILHQRADVILVTLQKFSRQLAVGLQACGALHKIGAQRGRPDSKRLLAVPKKSPFLECFSLD